MKKPIISAILLIFFVSCAQIQGLQDEPETYKSQEEKILTEKAEDRDLRLPSGSSIIENSGQGILGSLGLGSGMNFEVNSITFSVAR